MLLALTGMIAMQSCKKYTAVPFKEYHSFTVPSGEVPANEAVVHSGPNLDITWVSTSDDAGPAKADVYFGTTDPPDLFQAGVAATSLSVPVDSGQTYFWHVVMTDVNHVVIEGPTWSFAIWEPTLIFTGLFNADEPAESYSYEVSFVKDTRSSVKTDNYWNSGWTAIFNLDFTANTYKMDSTAFGGGYSAVEAGSIDQNTGTMIGHYIIYSGGANIEEGEHTYTKL